MIHFKRYCPAFCFVACHLAVVILGIVSCAHAVVNYITAENIYFVIAGISVTCYAMIAVGLNTLEYMANIEKYPGHEYAEFGINPERKRAGKYNKAVPLVCTAIVHIFLVFMAAGISADMFSLHSTQGNSINMIGGIFFIGIAIMLMSFGIQVMEFHLKKMKEVKDGQSSSC